MKSTSGRSGSVNTVPHRGGARFVTSQSDNVTVHDVTVGGGKVKGAAESVNSARYVHD